LTGLDIGQNRSAACLAGPAIEYLEPYREIHGTLDFRDAFFGEVLASESRFRHRLTLLWVPIWHAYWRGVGLFCNS
jgi:hypothetical protein